MLLFTDPSANIAPNSRSSVHDDGAFLRAQYLKPSLPGGQVTAWNGNVHDPLLLGHAKPHERPVIYGGNTQAVGGSNVETQASNFCITRAQTAGRGS